MKKHEDISKFLSLVLWHKPETIGLVLDENGWADVNDLVSKMDNLTMVTLEKIVETNDKKRFTFNEDKTKIRASQGHSLNINLELKPVEPPEVLYHGTADRFVEIIKSTGIKKQSRSHLHLSNNFDTAVSVGQRHGKPVVLEVNAKKMQEDGYKFYLSENNVWLTDIVPIEYIN